MIGRRRAMLVAGLLLVATTPPHAQPPRPKRAFVDPSPAGVALRANLDYVPAQRYGEIRGFIVAMGAEGGTLFNAPDGQTSYILARRTVASEVEEHSRWDDVLIVRSGAGTVEVGRRTTGARLAAAGELRGGTLTGASRVALRPGDILRVPAGVPHAFEPSGPVPWEFLIVKVRRANKPLKRSVNGLVIER